ncbi:MAG TPA: DUF2520 domain-containing protein [Candidatus Phocaeicola gallistercoris]|nr:DUF2520 domain-containing protein [Candidatus Phocaeicola gallistercoris]
MSTRAGYEKKALPNIALIGAGNVATHLGRALKQAGYKIIQLFSRTISSASELAEKLQCPYVTDLNLVTSNADIYLVSVKDDALDKVIPQLVKQNPNALFLHTSGSTSMNVWEGYVKRYGVLYPLQTFSKRFAVDFKTVTFYVEAVYPTDLDIVRQMAYSLSENVYETDSEQRLYVHLAAVFACNFSNHMYAIAYKLLQEKGLSFVPLLPLVDETVRKIHQLNPVGAQTGPARRWDRMIMNKHESLLKTCPGIADIYKKVSESIHSYAIKEYLIQE